jgi:hypothetical protein
MSATVETLDSFIQTRISKIGYVELDWSSDIQERIVLFDALCVRTDPYGVSALALFLDGLLRDLSINSLDGNIENARKNFLTVLYKIIGRTRDITGGKGEYNLSYMMIWIWFKYFPRLARGAFQMFVMDPHDYDLDFVSQVPYGSWKDVKYFCKYILDNGGTIEHPLIAFCIEGINSTLRIDDELYNSTSEEDRDKKLTLVAKWIPRENKKFGFLYNALAFDYFKEFFVTADNEASLKKAEKKCKTNYRMLCSKLNRHLDTVQIKQTAKNWASIDHAKTTSCTRTKQHKAFLNEKLYDDPDRIACADNLREHMKSVKKEEFPRTEDEDTIITYDALVARLNNERYSPLEKIIRGSF